MPRVAVSHRAAQITKGRAGNSIYAQPGEKRQNMWVVAWASDILTGPALPAFYSLLAVGGGATGLAVSVAGTCMALIYTFIRRWMLKRSAQYYGSMWQVNLNRSLFLYNSLLRICLNAAQLFRQAALVDSDVGAGLCVAPLYVLLCMQGSNASSDKYSKDMRLVGSALGIVVLLATILRYQFSDTSVPPSPETGLSSWALVLAVVDTFYACGNPGTWPGGAPTYIGLALRAAFFITVSVVPKLAHVITGEQPPWLFVLHGVLLVHSSMYQACHARMTLSKLFMDRRQFRAPQRSLMLIVAPALAVGFTFQWGDPWHASIAAFVLILAGLTALVIQLAGS